MVVKKIIFEILSIHKVSRRVPLLDLYFGGMKNEKT